MNNVKSVFLWPPQKPVSFLEHTKQNNNDLTPLYRVVNLFRPIMGKVNGFYTIAEIRKIKTSLLSLIIITL